jgi:hypothetical protein
MIRQVARQQVPVTSQRGLPARLVALGLAALAACTSRDAKSPPASAAQDTAVAAAVVVDSSKPQPREGWSAAYGDAVYLPATDGGAQIVLPPVHNDSVPPPAAAPVPAGAAPASIDLFAVGGLVRTVALGEFAAAAQADVAQGCDAWPVVPIRDATASAPPRWRIGLLHGVATPVPTDSLGGLAPNDAAALVVAINRAAAGRLDDSTSALRGVPFAVTKAYRLRYASDTETVVAVVERRLNVEASPKVERTTLILEKPPTAKSFAVVWRDAQYVSEDDLIAVDVLAAVRFSAAGRDAVFLSLDFGDGSTTELLERNADGRWGVRWMSAYTGC